MPVFDIDRTELEVAYSVQAGSLETVYDVGGNEIVLDGTPDIPVTPLTWNMTESYKSQILSALNFIKTYKRSNPGAYALCQFNDVHEAFNANEPNFIDYNKGYKVLDRMIFLGDMVETNTVTASRNAVAFINGAQASKRLVGMGNHEYFLSGITDPEAVYAPLTTETVTFMPTENNALIFYNDDEKNNVRYIFLDYYYITKTGANNGHLVDDAQLNWCASVMESAGNMNIIILAHTMMNPFFFANTGAQQSSAATLVNQQNLVDLINVFKARASKTITVDGVAHVHDFSACTGDFVMYTSGHWHALAHNDFGFQMITCPSLKRAYGAGQDVGFTFYIIDPRIKTIKAIMCSKNFSSYVSYDYDY